MAPTCPHMAWCLTNWDQYKVLFFDSRYQSQLIQFTVGGLQDRLTVFHQVNSGGTPGPGQTVSIDWTGWRSRGREKFCLLLYPGYALLFRAFRFCLHCVLSLWDFSLRVNVFYIKGFIRFFTFFLVLFFCWFSLFLFFPDWPTRFLQLTKGAITLFYDKQLHVTLFYEQQPCYRTMLHFSVINNSGERSHFFLWRTSS